MLKARAIRKALHSVDYRRTWEKKPSGNYTAYWQAFYNGEEIARAYRQDRCRQNAFYAIIAEHAH